MRTIYKIFMHNYTSLLYRRVYGSLQAHSKNCLVVLLHKNSVQTLSKQFISYNILQVSEWSLVMMSWLHRDTEVVVVILSQLWAVLGELKTENDERTIKPPPLLEEELVIALTRAVDLV